MEKDKIISYITGQITDQKEKAEVRRWINESNANKQMFIQLKNAYALTRKSSGITDVEEEYLKLQSKVPFRTRRLITEIFKYAAVIILTFGITWSIQKNYFNGQHAESMQMNEVICPAGQITELVLSDGSKVWLNAESRISYPSHFNTKQRSVQLTGEAFFEVKKDAERPFLVKTRSINIKVLGTSFNVDAYEKDQIEKITLVEGKVELQNKSGTRITEMFPGQLARYDRNNKKIHFSEVDTRFFSSWKEGKMTFFNEPLVMIAMKLERWYNVKITFASEEIKSYRFSGTILKYKPIDQILQVVKLSSLIDYKINVNPEDRNEIILTKID
ncbi:FecR family protein [Gaoshiqia sediminis]|uniref:FecR domain-containing protein n=1 Tax=Gaoshiqia sediminis TaxID=2986998 RepID=A0AA41Y9U9_9BACT|nr:FecR domain-containing protein [Gaoshiqia sediminis]MCW0483937.1 FecR domain-containing protein [Gaoshiqia sediminis]